MRSSAASRTAASATTALYNEHTAQGTIAKYRRRLTSYDPGMFTFKVCWVAGGGRTLRLPQIPA
jgi:hypothetical protein